MKPTRIIIRARRHDLSAAALIYTTRQAQCVQMEINLQIDQSERAQNFAMGGASSAHGELMRAKIAA